MLLHLFNLKNYILYTIYLILIHKFHIEKHM